VFALVRDTNSSPELTELAETKPNVHIVHGDLNSFSTLQAAAKTVSSITGGSLDILVNNGAFLDGSTAMISPSQLSDPENLEHVKDMFAKSFESNVMGTIYVTNSFLPLIEQGKEKRIVHITTGLSDTDFIMATGIAGLAPYSVSKAAMNSIVAKYGAELQAKGIHVVAMSPGWVDTSPMPQEAVQWMASLFQKVDPNVTGRISAEESVRDQVKTISTFGWEVQGKIISQHGDRNWF
jgi:NAD(P)-dependent dehydrogenase (short-subunit alcohol dehydrogenase family)